MAIIKENGLKRKKENESKTQALKKTEYFNWRSNTVKCFKMNNCKLI